MTLSDQEFITQFEDKTLSPNLFNHRGHLRLAWLYLNQYPLNTAISKVTVGIDAYASSLGAADKFHHTLTEAIVRIIASRLVRPNSEQNFGTFLSNNPDLTGMAAIIEAHYSSERLADTLAKKQFVTPDRVPIPITGGV